MPSSSTIPRSDPIERTRRVIVVISRADSDATFEAACAATYGAAAPSVSASSAA